MTGTYNGDTRDTDWFTCYGNGTTMMAMLCPSFPSQMILIYGTDCANLVYDLVTGSAYQEVSLSRVIGTGERVWIWVGPSVFSGVPCESPYLLWMSGIGSGQECEPVAARNSSWGSIRRMYR